MLLRSQVRGESEISSKGLPTQRGSKPGGTIPQVDPAGWVGLCEPDRSARPRFGSILTAVRRPDTSLGRGDAG